MSQWSPDRLSPLPAFTPPRTREQRQAMERYHRLLDLGELFELYGIKVGRGRRALCPWHGGEKPLLAVDSTKGRYRCYGQGCRHHGDHLDFLEQYVGLKREEALAELQRLSEQIDLTLPEGYTGPRFAR